MKVIEQTDATAPLAEYAAGVLREPLVVTSHGKPVAVLMPIDNTDLETASLSTNREFLDLIERSRAAVRDRGGVPAAEVRRRLA